jgi:hypothetical protein
MRRITYPARCGFRLRSALLRLIITGFIHTIPRLFGLSRKKAANSLLVKANGTAEAVKISISSYSVCP